MDDFSQARMTMVESQVRPNDVTDHRLLYAMSEVPREKFVPAGKRPLAYIDEDILISGDASSGQGRYLMEAMYLAKLLQLAGVGKDDLALDIGSGTGYSSAVLAQLADSVVAVECDEALVEEANTALSDLEIGNVAVVHGPLAQGCKQEGPYDVIMINGAVDAVPEALFAQLKDGGRLVAVVGRGPTGVAWVYLKTGETVAGRPAFDASVKALPGFEAEEVFTF